MQLFTLGDKIDGACAYDIKRGKKVCGRVIRFNGTYRGHAFKYGSEFGKGPSYRVADTAATPRAVVSKLNQLVTN